MKPAIVIPLIAFCVVIFMLGPEPMAFAQALTKSSGCTSNCTFTGASNFADAGFNSVYVKSTAAGICFNSACTSKMWDDGFGTLNMVGNVNIASTHPVNTTSSMQADHFHATGTTGAGPITLSGGTGTATVSSGAICVCSDSTANASVRCVVSSTTLTATGTGSDVITYICM